MAESGAAALETGSGARTVWIAFRYARILADVTYSAGLREIVDTASGAVSERDEVAMAFLFGSMVRERAVMESDIDVAVYFFAEDGRLEVEEETRYPAEDGLELDLCRALEREVDLVVLNRAPATLAGEVFSSGVPLLIRDRGLYWRYFLAATLVAEDFRDFTEDYLAIKRRSRSVSEAERTRLLRILDFLEQELEDRDQFADLTREQYVRDSRQRRNVERWVENIVNASIDIGKIVLAAERLVVPQTYRETPANMSTSPAYSSELARRLSSFTGLRHVLAHEYLDIRFARISRFVEEAPALYGDLLQSTRRWLAEQGSGEGAGSGGEY